MPDKIRIQITSTFDSGEGPEPVKDIFTADSWSEMIRVLIDHHSQAPVLPDSIVIEYHDV